MSTSTAVPASPSDKKTTSLKDDTSAINVPVRTTTLTGAIFNLTKSAVGAGTVFLPDIFYTLGPVVASTLLLSGAVFCSISLYFLGRMAHHCETGDYFKLGRLAMGRHGETAVSVSLLLFLIGGLIAYANLTGMYISSALAAWGAIDPKDTFFTEGKVTLLAALFGIFPLSCLRDMSMLAKTSIFGMISMLYIAGLLAYDALTHGTSMGIASAVERGTAPVTFESAYEFAFGLCGFVGKLVFAFVNHFTIVALVPVMKDPSAKSRMTLISVSTAAATIIYLMAALGGYYRFGSLAQGTDALSVFKDGAVVPMAYAVAKFALGIVLICSFPLLCDPARSCLDSLIFGASSSVSPVARHYLETGLIVAVPTAVAYFFQDQASDFLSLFAGFCGSLLVFTFPGSFFLILSRRFKYSVTPTEKALAYFCIVLGIVLAILSSYVNVSIIYTSMTKPAATA